MAFSDLEKRKHKNYFIENVTLARANIEQKPSRASSKLPRTQRNVWLKQGLFFFLFQTSKLEIVCILNATVFSIQMILLMARQSLLLGEVSKNKQTNKLNNSVKDKLMLGSRGLP